jgi:hypothetical protein
MTRTAAIILLAGLAACARPDAKEAAPPVLPDSVVSRALDALQRRDVEQLAALAHPSTGIRFTPYTRVDTVRDRRFTAAELRAQWNRPDSLLWGEFDGSGDPMRMTMAQYFNRFVADTDFAKAPRVARDSAPMGVGNSIYNLPEVYRGATIVEHNIPGTDPRYGGMDWRSLWLVFERVGAAWHLVGVVHGSWTT